jgi:hypothetical protein
MIQLIRFQELFLPVFEVGRILLFIAGLGSIVGVIAERRLIKALAFDVVFLAGLYAWAGTFFWVILTHGEFTIARLVIMAFSAGMQTTMMWARAVGTIGAIWRAWRTQQVA